MYKTDIGDEGVKYLTRMGKLKTLWLPKSVSDEGVKTLSNSLNAIRTLQLSGTRVTDSGISYLTRFKELETLGLHETNITGVGFKSFAKTQGRSLKRLYLAHTKIVDRNLKYLKGFSSLEVLDLNNTMVTDEGLDYLNDFPDLREIWLGWTNTTKKGIAVEGSGEA